MAEGISIGKEEALSSHDGLSAPQSLSWAQVSPGGRISECSQAFRQLLGLPGGKSFSYADIFCPADLHSELPHAHSILVANQDDLCTTGTLIHVSGQLIPVGLLYKRMGDTASRPQMYNRPFCVPMFVMIFRAS